MVKKVYQGFACIFTSILVIGFIIFFARFSAKMVLVNKLHMNSGLLQEVAGYTLGDWLGMQTIQEENQVSSEYQKYVDINSQMLQITSDEQETAAAEESMKQRLETYCNEKFAFYPSLKTLKQSYDRLIGWDIAYARADGAPYDLENGYTWMASEYKPTAGNARVAEMTERGRLCERNGVQFLYVQLPNRISVDEKEVPLGVSEHTNDNINAVIDGLKEEQTACYDLRQSMYAKGWNPKDGYYLTDGHWTPESGFAAAGCLAECLNENYRMKFDTGLFDENRYLTETYSLQNLSNHESVSILYPEFETNLRFCDFMRDGEYSGDFEAACIDKSMMDTVFRKRVLDVYSASRIRNTTLGMIENLDEVNNDTEILFYVNSMSWYLVPYLSLDLKRAYFTTGTTPEQMEYLVEQLQPDMVIAILL